MGFQSLPNELLFMITGQLRRSDLNALVQTCQRFYAVLNSTLYFDDIRLNHSSALFWAAANGNLRTIQCMLAHGADLQIRAESAAAAQLGLNLLKLANMPHNKGPIKTRHTRSTEKSLNKESLTFSTCGETLLHRVANCNQEAVARYLLDNGFDMLSIDIYGYYPIQLAARQGHKAVVELFLEKGFHPNTLSWATSDPSALHSAVWGGHSSIVKLLLDHGANASLKNEYSNLPTVPLDIALSGYGHYWSQRVENLQAMPGTKHVVSGIEDCALLLIEHDPQLEMFEENGYLVHATRKNFVKVVNSLLDLGIDTNMRLHGQNALSVAQNYRFQELVDILEPITRPTAKFKAKKQKTKP